MPIQVCSKTGAEILTRTLLSPAQLEARCDSLIRGGHPRVISGAKLPESVKRRDLARSLSRPTRPAPPPQTVSIPVPLPPELSDVTAVIQVTKRS